MPKSGIPATFRRDLILYPGPKEPNGAPSYSLYDPISAKYYKLGWEESHIYKLAKPGMSFAEITLHVNTNSTFQLDEEDVKAFYHQSAALGLLDLPKSSEQIIHEHQRSKSSTFWWVLMHYLYFRLPIFKPNAFLERTLPYVKLLWSTPAILLYILTSSIGVVGVFIHLDEYLHTFTYFFNFQGILFYALTISCLKIIHEASHAYTAKYYNIQVPTIGVAVIVLWPVLYTDVTDSWKLANRQQRLAISIAGITSELVIAGLSTFGWVVTSPGLLQSVFFLLSSSTWIRSLLINFNPAMRFDGYYILCDLWGIDNLRQRAFAVTQWKLHECFFGFNLPCPEDGLSNKRIRGMVVYSLFTWVYLLTIYTIIATFVYYEFAKALGIILFLLEIAIFFVWPVVGEFQDMYKLRGYFRLNLRTLITLAAFTFIASWLVIPLPRHESVHAITIPQEEQILYGVEEGRIKTINFKQGDLVAVGDPILVISQNKLEIEIKIKKEEINLLERIIQVLSLQPEQHSAIPQKRAELQSLKEQLKVLNAAESYLVLKAMIPGTLYALDDTLKAGQPIGKNQIIGKIANTEKMAAIAFIPENLVRIAHPGQTVQFRLPYTSETFRGKISYIESTPATTLSFPSMSSRYKGPLATTFDLKAKGLRLIDNYFQAKIILEDTGDTHLRYGTIGEVLIVTPPESLVMRIWGYLSGLFTRESAL